MQKKFLTIYVDNFRRQGSLTPHSFYVDYDDFLSEVYSLEKKGKNQVWQYMAVIIACGRLRQEFEAI